LYQLIYQFKDDPSLNRVVFNWRSCFCRMEAEEYVKVIKLALVKKGQTSTVFKTFEVFKKKVLRIAVI